MFRPGGPKHVETNGSGGLPIPPSPDAPQESTFYVTVRLVLTVL